MNIYINSETFQSIYSKVPSTWLYFRIIMICMEYLTVKQIPSENILKTDT